MITWIKRTFGLPGSWTWACRQLDRGHIVRRATDTGSAKYKLDDEDQRRILWTFTRSRADARDGLVRWENANLFLSDFDCTEWEIWPVTENSRSGFSDFIRNASPEEKERVYGRVIDEANEAQRKLTGKG